MTDEDEDPIVLSLAEYFELDGLDDGRFPITIEVRDQLTALLQATPGPQLEALFQAIMTTVMNLELANLNCGNDVLDVGNDLLELKSEVIHLRINAMEVWTNMLQLRTELTKRRAIAPTPAPDIEWFPED